MLAIHAVDVSRVAAGLNTFPIHPDILHGVDLDGWRGRAFELCWTAHGGSGLGLSWQDVMELDAAEADWLYQAINKRRKDEAASIKAAARKG